ncbi:MAG: ABC transporter permease [Acidobacteriia bacterium]|nr:ABC transporter permease [Terriglobia bacterium]
MQDLRFGARLLWKSPGFTAVAAATLALGIGAASAIFSIVDAVLLKPLPFIQPERLAAIWERNPSAGRESMFVAPANFREWQRASTAVESLAAIQDTHVNLTGDPDGRVVAEELRGERVSAGLFAMLGVRPLVGRTFHAEEDRPGRADYALLSYGLWQRRFGADNAIAGKPIRLGDRSYTVLGVMPRGFRVLDPGVEIWVPLALDPDDVRASGLRYLEVIARLRADATLAGARVELETIGRRLEAANPALNRGWRPEIVSLREELEGRFEPALVTLMAAVGFLLLMSCANIANLLLARGAGRRKEIAIRAALGAGRGRIAAGLFLESILLALAGGALGVVLAPLGVWLLAHFGPAEIPRLREAAVDGRMVLFALAVSVASGVLFGCIPAIQASSAKLNAALAEGGRGGTSGAAGRTIRSALVVFEVALAVVVLVGAGLLMRSFVRLRAADPGFRIPDILSFRLPLAGGRLAEPGRRASFLAEVQARIAALPGVQSVGAINIMPLGGLSPGTSFTVAGRPAPPPGERPMALLRTATPGYFRTMGIALVAGREFSPSDTAQAMPAVIVSRSLAERFWPGGTALRNHLIVDNLGGREAEIVGVAGDVKPEKLEDEDWPTIYNAYPQAPAPTMTVVARTGPPPPALASAVQQEIHRLDPGQPVADLRAMDDVLGGVLAGPRFNAALLALFGCMAFTLAAVGIYGVISYDVSRRTNEIGIRAALGARPSDLHRLILLQGARLAAYGIALGLAAAFALTRLMANLLYGIRPADAWTFAAVSILLGGVALAASYLPSRRAMALDPVAALRHE